MAKARVWRRDDFTDSASFQAWKASGRKTAKPYERAGFSTDYQYRKARKAFKNYASHKPLPDVRQLKRVTTSQAKSKQAGRIDKSLLTARRPGGKSRQYAVAVNVKFKDGESRAFSIRFPNLPSEKRVIREAALRISDPGVFTGYYGKKSDPESPTREVETISVINVTKPAGK